MLGLSSSLVKGGASLLTFVKDNLKLYLDFNSKKSDTLKFPSEGSTEFDGSGDRIDCGQIDVSGQSITLSAWVYRDGTTDDTIAGRWSSNGAMLYCSGSSVVWYINGNNSSVSIPDKTWVHIVGTFDGVNRKVYKDGVLGDTDADTGTIVNPSENFEIGNAEFSSGKEFNGKISSVSLYKTALDAQTISQMAKSRFTPMRDNRFSVVDFDGSNDYIVTSGNVGITGASARTLGLWFKPDATNQYYELMEWGGTGTANGTCGFYLYLSKIFFYGWGAGDFDTGVAPLSTWQHLYATYDGTTVKVYLNGALIGSSSESLNTADTVLKIGNSQGNEFAGSISSVSIYDVAKTEQEIYALYQKGITYDESSENGLHAYYRMGDDTSAVYPTIADSSSNSNDGTITNGESADIVQQMVAGYDLGAFESSSEELGANLVTNSTFDSDITGWSLNSADDNVSISQATVDGKICLDINDQSSNRRNAQFDLGGNAEDGEVYKISYYARKSQTGSTSKDFIVGLGLSNVGGDAGNVDKTVAEYDTWEFQEIHVICGSANNYVQFLPTAYANAHTGRLFLDDVKVQKVLQSEVSDAYPAIIDVNEPVLGVELSPDSDFTLSGTQGASTAGTYWTTGTNTTIADGKVTKTGGGSATLSSTNEIVTQGKLYQATIVIDEIDENTVNVIFSGTGSSKRVGGVGTHKVNGRANDTNERVYIGLDYHLDCVISFFSIKEIQGNVGTMTNQDSADLVYSSVLPDQSFLTGVNSAYNFIDLDGSDELIDCGDINEIDGASVLSISAWIKCDVTSGNHIILSKYSSLTSRIEFLVSSNSLFVAVPDGSTMQGLVSFTDTGWNHVAVIFDGSGTGNTGRLKIYLNGENQTLSYNGTIPSTLPDIGSNVVTIGGRSGSSSLGFNGGMGQVSIFNKAISEIEVNAINTAGRHSNLLDSYSDNLLGYWAMGALDAKTGLSDVGDGTIYDRSGNSNHGTATNTESADLKSSPNAEPNGYAKGDTNRSTTTP